MRYTSFFIVLYCIIHISNKRRRPAKATVYLHVCNSSITLTALSMCACMYVRYIQMRQACQIRLTSRAFKRGRNVHSKTIYERNIPINQHASANCSYDFLHYVQSRHKSLNNCSSYDLSAKHP